MLRKVSFKLQTQCLFILPIRWNKLSFKEGVRELISEWMHPWIYFLFCHYNCWVFCRLQRRVQIYRLCYKNYIAFVWLIVRIGWLGRNWGWRQLITIEWNRYRTWFLLGRGKYLRVQLIWWFYRWRKVKFR